MKATIKQQTIEAINKVLRTHKKFYISSDFPFVQIINFYLTHQGRVMNQYLREKGFTVVLAKDVDLKRTDVNVRANRNIWIKTVNYINYRSKL
jgi:hypothetical protein